MTTNSPTATNSTSATNSTRPGNGCAPRRRFAAVGAVAAAVLIGSSALAPAAHAGTLDAFRATPTAALDGTMRDVARQVLAAGAPGYVARIDDGRRVHVTVAGLADTTTRRPITSRDQFEIGSNTKTFMATLALQLVDRGKLELDAPVSRYLPGVVPDGEHITVRMLLNHTSGLFSYTGDEDFLTAVMRDPQHTYTEQELLDIAFAHAPNFAPGTSWSYSNTNYTLIGMILQKQTGQSLPDLVQRRIARPLGLTHTYYANPRATDTGPGYAHGYGVSFAAATPTYLDTATWPIGSWGGAAGAIISTPDDLSRFFSGVLSGKLFSRTQLQQMKTTITLPDGYPITGGYGLGLFEIHSPCGTVWGHGGDTLGHHSTAVVSDDGRRTAVSDTNANMIDLTDNAGVNRFIQVAFAAEDVTICQMLDQPVPDSVTQALHGTTPTPSPAAAR